MELHGVCTLPRRSRTILTIRRNMEFSIHEQILESNAFDAPQFLRIYAEELTES